MHLASRRTLLVGDARDQHDGRHGALVLHPVNSVAVSREGVAGTVFLSDIATMVDDLSRQDVDDLGTILVAMLAVGGAGFVGSELHAHGAALHAVHFRREIKTGERL